MKKTDNNTPAIDEKQLKKIEAEKLKKQKAREAKKAKRLALIEKRKAKVEANKKKREAKKAKRLAKLEKERAKKAAAREKKRLVRQKQLEKIAKQKAKEKERKQKAREKAKLEKQKIKDAASKKAPTKDNDTIGITINILKKYVKQLAKDAASIDDKKIKKLKKLGFIFDDDSVSFVSSAKLKTKKGVTPAPAANDQPKENKNNAKDVEVVEPEVVDGGVDTTEIDAAIDAAIGENADAIAALANELESNDTGTETPVGDTFTDNATYDQSVPDDEDDDTIDDFRDEDDADKVDFRHDWNDEFDDDGERNENW